MNKFKEFKNSHMDISVDNYAEMKSMCETEKIRKNRLNHHKNPYSQNHPLFVLFDTIYVETYTGEAMNFKGIRKRN